MRAPHRYRLPGPRLLASVFSLTLTANLLIAQPAQLTIAEAVDQALRSYPAIRVTQEQMNAAAAAVELARTSYLPRVDGLAQVNRATRNNVFGLLLPQSVIPSISGPVLGTNNLGSAWGSAAGALVSWQPFDFGLRKANVNAAAAALEQTRASLERSRFEVSVAAADAFLTVIAAQQSAKAATAAVESWQVLARSIHALVAAQLRPGADESRVLAELAAAEARSAQAEQAIAVGCAALNEFAAAGQCSDLAAGRMAETLPQDDSAAPLNLSANPFAKEQTAAIAREEARLAAIERSGYPQFLLQGAASARGTGLETNGARMGGLNGLAPTYQNYALGFTVFFPFMDRYAVRQQEAAQSAAIRAGQAQYQLIATQLKARFDAGMAALAGARRVAAATPAEASSAQTALQQATARYQSGLAPVDDVAQAQRLLTQAQIDDALARLSVWRALLQTGAARGDIQPFLAEASR